MRKKMFLAGTFVIFMFLLAGCTQVNEYSMPVKNGIWYQYIVYPLSWIIIQAAKLLGNSYGLSIIVVTIFVRLVILPLMVKQTNSSKKMKMIEPELKEIQLKYNLQDTGMQKKMQQETMQLFRRYNVNPLAGCLPLLIQVPILIGFYYAINDTPALHNSHFLWFYLGSPDIIVAVFAGFTTFLQQKAMMADTYRQNPQMAMMLWVMPVMTALLSAGIPAALPLYWIAGNLFIVVQTYLIKVPMLQKESTDGGNLEGAKK